MEFKFFDNDDQSAKTLFVSQCLLGTAGVDQRYGERLIILVGVQRGSGGMAPRSNSRVLHFRHKLILRCKYL